MLGISYSVFAGITFWILRYILPSCFLEYYDSVACTLLSLIVIYSAYPIFRQRYLSGKVTPHNKAVLITGCDSGFGHELAKRLDSKGYHVFAGCLFPDGDGAEKLGTTCSSRLHVLPLDVRDDVSVADAVRFVKENMTAAELWAIVNNAGVLRGNSVEWSQMEDFQSCLEVNTLGPVRVTRAFLPLLRASRGRVVNITSLGGRLCIPHITPYIMSKFAAVAFSDCLRLEMKAWGVQVISIEPEGFKTPMADLGNMKKNFKESVGSVNKEIRNDYGEGYFQAFEEFMERCSNKASDKIHRVVDSMEDAVSLKHPKNVYRPTRNFIMSVCINILLILPLDVKEFVVSVGNILIGLPCPKEAEMLI